MRVLIVDDESLARERLHRIINDLPDYSVCAEASHGQQALELIAIKHPDIVLMDIRMPGMDGLEAAKLISQQKHPPAVIFTTAYGEHALEAFSTYAQGYLLKPIRREALVQALEKACRISRAQLFNLNTSNSNAESNTPAPVFIHAKIGSKLERIALDDVLYFRADQKYVTVRHLSGEVVIEDSLKSLSERFGKRFLRIHRNTLIAAQRLTALERGRDGQYYAQLTDLDTTLEVSRRHVSELKDFLRGREHRKFSAVSS